MATDPELTHIEVVQALLGHTQEIPYTDHAPPATVKLEFVPKPAAEPKQAKPKGRPPKQKPTEPAKEKEVQPEAEVPPAEVHVPAPAPVAEFDPVADREQLVAEIEALPRLSKPEGPKTAPDLPNDSAVEIAAEPKAPKTPRAKQTPKCRKCKEEGHWAHKCTFEKPVLDSPVLLAPPGVDPNPTPVPEHLFDAANLGLQIHDRTGEPIDRNNLPYPYGPKPHIEIADEEFSTQAFRVVKSAGLAAAAFVLGMNYF